MAPAQTAMIVHPVLSNEIQELTSVVIRDPIALAQKVRAIERVAHVISSAAGFGAIPPNVVITPVPVVIDPTFDEKTGRGTDVYYQKSIHKSERKGSGQSATYVPLEVSLNANGIKKLLGAAGVRITKSQRTDDGKNPHYCSWTTHGEIREFDGSWRPLPPGDVENDLRDGSDFIGGWTADEWERVDREAKERAAAEKAKGNQDHWKIRGEIGGWSADRVSQQRKSIVPIAQTKSLNRLGRNIGLKQVYTIAELQEKPFVIFRASWHHDMTNPDVAKMVTANELRALQLLFPASAPTAALPPAVQTQAADATTSAPETESSEASAAASSTESTTPQTAAVPADAQEIDDILEPVAEKPADVFDIVRASFLNGRYFFETTQKKTFTTTDLETAKALNEARKAKRQLVIDNEPIELDGQPYLNVVECRAFTPASSTLPDPTKL